MLDLQALRRHYINNTHQGGTLLEIFVCEHSSPCRPQMCRSQKLYLTKKKPNVNTTQKHCHLWAKANQKWTEAKWETVLATFSSVKVTLMLQGMFQSIKCSHPDDIHFREGLAYFSKTTINHALHLFLSWK